MTTPVEPATDEHLVEQDEPARALSVDRASLQTVVSSAALNEAWKRLLRRLRVTRFPDLVMLRDPLEWAAAELSWEAHREALISKVLSHRYRPQPAEELRAAKSKGLSRAMSYLSLDDQLLYLTLVQHTKSQLLALTEPWTRSGRQDSDDIEDDDETGGDYSGVTKSWFDRWLATQKTIAKILDECPLIVETDISNFFPSIQLEVLRNRLAVAGTLDHAAVELLTYVASEVGPPRKLQRSVTTGLPVEDHDCSRTLAHFLLAEVDDKFKVEGEAGHYARFVDDVAFGAVSEADAKRKLGRFQDAVDRVGLYPNSAKTRWFTRAEYDREYHRVENDQLGEIEHLIGQGDDELARSALKTFVPGLLAVENRGRGWDRVLRRACTIGRKARSEALLQPLPALLWELPSAARHLLEYRTSFPLNDFDAAALLSAYDEHRGVYEDIDALIFEYLAVAPVAVSTRGSIRDAAMKAIKGEFQRRPVVSAAAAVCLSKHSTSTELGPISTWAGKAIPSAQDTVAMRTCVVILAARRADKTLARQAVRRSPSLHMSIDFLDALEDGDNKAIQISKSLLGLTEKKDPDRLAARARPLLLLPSLTRQPEKVWRQVSDNERKRYATQREAFPDRSLEERWEWSFD